jgi:hypothetical protein
MTLISIVMLHDHVALFVSVQGVQLQHDLAALACAVGSSNVAVAVQF